MKDENQIATQEYFSIRSRYENEPIDFLINISDPTEDLKRLIDADEIIVNNNEATIIVRYPLNDSATFTISSENKKGFTRKEIVEHVCNIYKRIYKEEDETTTEVEPRSNNGVTVLNRSRTNGKYGIWGHVIEDLLLEGIIVHTLKNITVIELEVES